MPNDWLYRLMMFFSQRERKHFLSKNLFLLSILFLVFACGIFVGKRFSDVSHETRLAQLSNCQNKIALSKEPIAAETAAAVDPLQETFKNDEFASEVINSNRIPASQKTIEEKDHPKKQLEKKSIEEPTEKPVRIEKPKDSTRTNHNEKNTVSCKKVMDQQFEAFRTGDSKALKLLKEKSPNCFKDLEENSVQQTPIPEEVTTKVLVTKANVSETSTQLTKDSKPSEELSTHSKLSSNPRINLFETTAVASSLSAVTAKSESVNPVAIVKNDISVDLIQKEVTVAREPGSVRREKLEYIGIPMPAEENYTIQLKSSTSAAEAESFLKKLDIDQKPKFIIAIKFIDEKETRFRSCVGTFKTKAEAQKFNDEYLVVKFPLLKPLVRNLVK